jgi:DNA-binding transcriptional ArsR family regulator
MRTELLIQLESVKKGAGVLLALINKKRQQLITELHQRKKSNVTDLYKKIKWEESAMSQHLRVLREARFILTERDSKVIYYSLNYDRFAEVDGLLKAIIQ